MHRRTFLVAITVVSLGFPVAARADFVDDMVAALSGQGYADIQVMRTLLGRTRILASSAEGTRELVLNPRTGEILRDVWVTNGGVSLPALSGSIGGGADSGSANNGRGHGDDEPDDDDEDDDDNGDGHGSDDDSSGQGSGHSDD